jgi:hypothetical protein
MKLKNLLFAVLFFGLVPTTQAQSLYMTPESGYEANDIFAEYLFSTFDVKDGILYGFDSNGLHAINVETSELIFEVDKPESYNGQPAFLAVDPESDFIWMGFTNYTTQDDRIYTLNLENHIWEHKASLISNFDIAFGNDQIFVSGLNSSDWSAPNCIWLLDLSGSEDHQKLIEIGGSSAGLARDNEGNIYYASYFSSEDNFVYKWSNSDVTSVIGTSNTLTTADAEILSALPNGAYDCDFDGSNNLLFNSNDSEDGFLAVWNGTASSDHNYNIIAYSGEWMTYLKGEDNINAGGSVYTMAYGTAICKITNTNGSSTGVEVVNPLADLNLAKNHADVTIDLSNVFEGESLTYEVTSNTNTTLISTSVSGADLTLVITSDMLGDASITVKATDGTDEATDSFDVSVFDYDYTEGVFIVNEDWFGHDNGTANFITPEGNVVYRAYRHENEGETFGVTTQHAEAFGEHLFFISKQDTRFVMANRVTLEKEFVAEEIGGDGRAFAGVSPEKAYVGSTEGVKIFDIENMTFTGSVDGISGEAGMMVAAGNYVFIFQGSDIKVVENDVVVETLSTSSTLQGLCLAQDGFVYAAESDKLNKINPATLDVETIDLPDGVGIYGSNGDWNAGSLCASTTDNILYWTQSEGTGSGKDLYRYEIGNPSSLDEAFFTLPDDWVYYAAGIRVHPLTNEIYITAKKDGWGENSLYNRIFVVDGDNASVNNQIDLEEYYWFPAKPLMVDKYLPDFISTLEIEEDENCAPIQINLADYISDMDNHDLAMSYSVVSVGNPSLIAATIDNRTLNIVVTPELFGNTSIEIEVVSNGRINVLEIPVSIIEGNGINTNADAGMNVYPNPCQGFVNIEMNVVNNQTVQLFNTTGQLVKEFIMDSGKKTINTNNIKPGYYILKTRSGENVISKKLIVK